MFRPATARQVLLISLCLTILSAFCRKHHQQHIVLVASLINPYLLFLLPFKAHIV